MNQEIITTLEDIYQEKALHWQVIVQESSLHIYVNHEANCELDCEQLTSNVCHAVASVEHYRGFWLYTRVLGEVEPEWQTFVSLEADLATKESNGLTDNDAINKLEQNSIIPVRESKNQEFTEESNSKSFIPDEVKASSEDIEDREKEIIKKAEINSSANITENNNNNSVVPLPVFQNDEDSEVKETKAYLTEYCFIRNKRLLSSELVAPKLNIANLIQSLHELSESERKFLLPLLDKFLRLNEPVTDYSATSDINAWGNPKRRGLLNGRSLLSPLVNLENCSPEIQAWWEQITVLNAEEKRKAAIWLSRYCFDLELTLTQIQAVFDAEAAKQAAQQLPDDNLPIDKPNKALSQKTESKNINRSRIKNKQTKQNNKHQKNSIKPTHSLTRINLLVPISWLLVTIIFLFLGIGHANSDRLASKQTIPSFCQNIADTDTLNYCQLAVDFVGNNLLTEIQQRSSTFPDYNEEEALANCELLVNLRAGIPFADANPIKSRAIYSYGETILPGIYVAEAEQYNTKETGEANVRIACVYSQSKKRVQLLTTDVIPNNWPVEPYEGKSPLKDIQIINKALGIYSFLIFMGAGTLFTCIGLFIASRFNLGITIYSLDALYQSAFILGLVETIFATAKMPMLGGIFIFLALKTIALGITGACVKGLKVHWNEGYRTVALGTITVIGIKEFLQYYLILLISAFIT